MALAFRPQQEENLLLRELPLPEAFDAAPPLSSTKREAVRRAEADEARRLLARFAELPGGLAAEAITRVVRVQNRRLWGRYVDRRGEVAEDTRRHGGLSPVSFALTASERGAEALGALQSAAGERLLFHGADPQTIVSIVTGGFECRIASMGGALGAGAYFAENASYSNNYSKMPPHAALPGAGHRPGMPAPPQAAPSPALQQATDELIRALPPGQLLMIIARVSLGRTGAAASQGRIAPPGFQSVGDGAAARRSQIYAVFDNFQAYPAYVIQYDPAKIGGGAMAGMPAGALAGAAFMGAAAGGGAAAAIAAMMGGAGGIPAGWTPQMAAMAAMGMPYGAPSKRRRRGR